MKMFVRGVGFVILCMSSLYRLVYYGIWKESRRRIGGELRKKKRIGGGRREIERGGRKGNIRIEIETGIGIEIETGTGTEIETGIEIGIEIETGGERKRDIEGVIVEIEVVMDTMMGQREEKGEVAVVDMKDQSRRSEFVEITHTLAWWGVDCIKL